MSDVDLHIETESGDIKSTLISRNVTILGRRTSVRLEPEMWRALREIATIEHCTVHEICSLIALRKNKNTSMTAAIRVFLMLYYRAASTEDGHLRAGHGSFENMKKRAGVTLANTGVLRPRNSYRPSVGLESGQVIVAARG